MVSDVVNNYVLCSVDMATIFLFDIGISTLPCMQTTESIDLPNEGYGFGFTLEHDESGGSVILSVVPGGIAENVCTNTL